MGLRDDGITLQTLAENLAERSREICELNHCDVDGSAGNGEHYCESYAYIREDGALLDVCASDYFQGCARPYAAVSLPWNGDGVELAAEVDAQCDEMRYQSAL